MDLRLRRRLAISAIVELKLKIGQGAQAAQHGLRAALRGKVHQKAVEGIHLHPGCSVQAGPQHLHPLLEGKEELLFRVRQDGHDDAVEDFQPAVDQIQMAVGDGVKRARIDGDAFHSAVSSWSRPEARMSGGEIGRPTHSTHVKNDTSVLP